MTWLPFAIGGLVIVALGVLAILRARAKAKLAKALKVTAAGLDDDEMDENFAHEVTPADRGVK